MVRAYWENLKYDFEGKHRKATEAEILELKELGKNRLPDAFIKTYEKAMPTEEIAWDDFKIYPLETIKVENLDAVPGVNLYPLGFFTFASTFDGDAICIDLNDSKFPVYQCSHSLLGDGTRISFYKGGKMQHYEFTYENIIKISMKLAANYEKFLRLWSDYELESYSVTEMIDKFNV